MCKAEKSAIAYGMDARLPPTNHNAPKLTLAGEWYRQRDEWMRDLTERHDLSLSARLVGVHIALRMNRKSQNVTHLQKTLAKQTGLAEATVKAALRELRRAGLIEAEKGERGKNGKALNRYYLVYAWH